MNFLENDFFLKNFRNIELLDKTKSVLVIFSAGYAEIAKKAYDEISSTVANIFIQYANDQIICACRFPSNYDVFVVIGIECPEHRFKNAVTYFEETLTFTENTEFIADSLFNVIKSSCDMEAKNTDKRLAVITKNQNFYNYFCKMSDKETYPYFPDTIENLDICSFLLKESIFGKKLEKHNVIAVIFTSPVYSKLADDVIRALKNKSCYKLFLRDISFERIASIDNCEMAILIDCPLFIYTGIQKHYITPYSAYTYLKNEWGTAKYNQNISFSNFVDSDKTISSKTTIITLEEKSHHLYESIKERSFKGVEYKSQTEDMQIHEGYSGIAGGYEDEQELNE